MDVDRGRERPNDEDEKSFEHFQRLFKDVQYMIMFNGRVSIRDMKNRCSVNREWRKICSDKAVWKRLFIRKYVAEAQAEERRLDRLADWADDPLVQAWDAHAAALAAYGAYSGYAHLVAEIVAASVKRGLIRVLRYADDNDIWNVFWMNYINHDTCALYPGRAAAYGNFPDLLRTTLTGLEQERGVVENGRDHMLPAGWYVMNEERFVCVLVYLMERGWHWETATPESAAWYNAAFAQRCIQCGAQATMKCFHCEAVYCGTQCLK